MATKYWISTSSTSFSTAANWSDGIAPANSDVLIFSSRGTANCSTDLSTSLTGVTVIVEKSYPGRIGNIDATGTTATYLVLDGGTLFVKADSGGSAASTGSPLIAINFGSTAATAYVEDSASTSAISTLQPVLLKGTSLTVFQSGGRVGIAAIPAETATVTHRIADQLGAIAPLVYFGRGATISDLDMLNGTAISDSSNTVAAVTLTGGTYTHRGTGAHTAIIVASGGTCNYDGSGTITTLTNYGTFRRTRGSAALTITTANLYPGCSYLLDNGLASSTTRSTSNILGRIQDMTITLPYGEKL